MRVAIAIGLTVIRLPNTLRLHWCIFFGTLPACCVNLKSCSHGTEKSAHRFELRELAPRCWNPRGGDRRSDQGCDRAPACQRDEEKEDHQAADGRVDEDQPRASRSPARP